MERMKITKKKRRLIVKVLISLIVILLGYFGYGEIQEYKDASYTPPPNIEIGSITYIDTGEIEEGGALSFDESKIPEYSDSPYITINNNIPSFMDSDLEKAKESFIYLSELDELGRCGITVASIGPDTLATEERGSIQHVKPTGWHTIRYDTIIEDKYLYNRCHLLGYQLTGILDDERNLITGTRYFNVTGMLPFENEVAKYVRQTGNHVLFSVDPIFEGSDLVAKGVHMQARSIEDEGKGVLYSVFVYNVQPGIIIDYATGDSYGADGTQGTHGGF